MGNSDSHQTTVKIQPYALPELSNSTITKTITQPTFNNNNNHISTSLKMPTFTESFDDNTAAERDHFDGIVPWNLGRSASTDTVSTFATQSTLQSTSTYPYTDVSKLLYYMDSNKLASLTKYIVENEAYFSRHKHESDNIYHAIINYRIKGKMLIKYTNVQFCDELPWIKVSLKSLLYDRLRSLNDDEINTYLSKIKNHKNIPPKIIKLPVYLAQIDITCPERDTDIKYSLSMCTAQELQIFVYILCICTDAYNENDIKMLLNVLIQLDLTGAQFMQLKRTDFYRKLKPYNIKAAIASKLYKVLLSHSHNIYQYIDEHNISLIIQQKPQPPVLETRYSDEVVDELVNLKYGTKNECITASVLTVNYWDINDVADTLNNEHNFHGFLYNLCYINGYNESDIEAVLSALNNVNMKDFMELKRIDFVRRLKGYGITGAKAAKIYKLIKENNENVSEEYKLNLETSSNNYSGSTCTVEYSTDKLQLEKDNTPISISVITENSDGKQIESYEDQNINAFNVCLLNLLKHEFDENDMKCIRNALTKMNMNVEEFMAMKRVTFCRKLREYDIKGAVASKLYKLIVEKHENIAQSTCTSYKQTTYTNAELSEFAVCDFHITAHKMLQKMNDWMKKNMVNGMGLVEHYENKQELQIYLKANIPQKYVNVLCDLLWKGYEKNNEMNRTINTYNRKQLLKYFISLYRHYVKYVVIKHDLNEEKFMSLKRKEICDIFIGECGFSIGVATNIVDKIYNKINESKQN